MEHNHNPLIYGFLLSFFMFGMGVFMAFLTPSGADLHSKVVFTVVSILLVSGGIIMIRGTFQTRDECVICKDRYRYGRKK